MTKWDDPSRLQAVLDSLDKKPPHAAPELLFQWQRVARLRPKVFIEVGSRHGRGLRCWAEACDEDALVIAVEWPEKCWGQSGSLENLQRNMEIIEESGRTTRLIQGDSHADDVQQLVLDTLAGRSVGAVYVDGDHTYDGVNLDWEFFGPLVRPGGAFMLHDVNPIQKNDRIEVSRLFLELAQTHRAEILVTCLSNHGAGVVWME